MQALARSARKGDKQAQLALGERYERGDGVARDLALAARLYIDAASHVPGTQWIYGPPVNGRTAGTMIGVDGGVTVRGLPAARERLERLFGNAP